MGERHGRWLNSSEVQQIELGFGLFLHRTPGSQVHLIAVA